MTEPAIKSCRTCEHKIHGEFGLHKCGFTGHLCDTERAHLDVCDANFSAWAPRSSWWQRIKQRLFGVHEAGVIVRRDEGSNIITIQPRRKP